MYTYVRLRQEVVMIMVSYFTDDYIITYMMMLNVEGSNGMTTATAVLM